VNVVYYEKSDILLSQLLNEVPTEGQGIKIKGRKGEVLRVERINEKKFHVHVELMKEDKNKKEVIKKNK
jgi:phage-related protein